jgi:hypothetical protein
VSLKEADPKLFDMYRLCSQPSVRYVGDAEDSGCGCTKSKSDAGGNLSDTATRDITIVAEGFTGDYEYTVLEATSTKGLLAWLDEHGWSTMGADDALDAYVAAGGFQFVSIALTPTVSERPSRVMTSAPAHPLRSDLLPGDDGARRDGSHRDPDASSSRRGRATVSAGAQKIGTLMRRTGTGRTRRSTIACELGGARRLRNRGGDDVRPRDVRDAPNR